MISEIEHSIFLNGDWDLEKITNYFGDNPAILINALKRRSCTVDVVKLLLNHGVDVNYEDCDAHTALMTALAISDDKEVIRELLKAGAEVNELDVLRRNSLMRFLQRKDCSAVIRMLLEGGADVNTLDVIGKSPLCIAFRHSSNDIQKLLLDAGSSPNACKYHASALHCATDLSHSGLREDILKLLLKMKVDMNSINEYGQSVLCFALQHGAKADDIQLLLNSGALLSTCSYHSSPLVCATGGWQGTLREDVVQLLLDNGASVNDQGLRVLQVALRYRNYEFGAIQLLLDLPGMDAYVVSSECNASLLHLAVQNPNCRLDAVKLLVNLKAEKYKADRRGETPLHKAVRNKTCDPSIVKFLLQNGSPINATNISGETPLMLAVNIKPRVNILKELLIAGAHIGKSKFKIFSFECELLEFLVRQFERCDEERRECYRMLFKFFLLQNPKFNVGDFEHDPAYCKNKLLIFMNECLSEVKKMDSMQVGHGHTFRMFVSRHVLSVEKIYDLNQILICLMKTTFPVYFDVISARIDRSMMEAEVNKLQVYTSIIRPDSLHVKRVQLNCDIARKISQYLPDEDLLKFILVYYRPVNQNDSGETSKDNTLLVKRPSKPSSRPRKQPKLCP